MQREVNFIWFPMLTNDLVSLIHHVYLAFDINNLIMLLLSSHFHQNRIGFEMHIGVNYSFNLSKERVETVVKTSKITFLDFIMVSYVHHKRWWQITYLEGAYSATIRDGLLCKEVSRKIGSRLSVLISSLAVVYFSKVKPGALTSLIDGFKQELRVTLDKVDKIECCIVGAKFLLKTVKHESFMSMRGRKVQIYRSDLYRYLLVNIDYGVNKIRIEREGRFLTASGTSLCGGTFYGLGKFLIRGRNFEELLELSQLPKNRMIVMLCKGMKYSKISLEDGGECLQNSFY